MSGYWDLYKKDLKDTLFLMVVLMLLITAWQVFLFYKSSVWPLGTAAGLSFIPFFFLPLIPLWNGYQSLRREWKDDTIYFLLSLPRPGWQLTLSKLMAGMTNYIVLSLVTGVLTYIFHRGFFISSLQGVPFSRMLPGFIFKVAIAYILFGLNLLILSQFTCLVTQFYDRFKGLVSIIVFILSGYIVHRGGSLLGPIFNWLPDIPVHGFNNSFGHVQLQTISIGSGPIAASFIMLILLFVVGSWLLQKHLEV